MNASKIVKETLESSVTASDVHSSQNIILGGIVVLLGLILTELQSRNEYRDTEK